MKKILIVMDSMRIGGIQKSLVNLLDTIDYTKYQVDLFLFNSNTSYNINKNVRIINSDWLLNTVSISKDEAKKNGLFNYVIRMFFSVIAKLFGANFMYSIIFLFEKFLKNYDVAISFTNNIDEKSVYFGCNKYVLEKVTSKKKISWLHTDYNVIKSHINAQEYKKFDKVVAVSAFGARTLINNIPEIKDKVVIINNIIKEEEIVLKSSEFIPNFDKDKINIVSVGRLDINKNQIEQLKIVKKLKKSGIKNIMLYIIGDGPERKMLENYITDNKLEKNVLITGYIENVLPYVKNSTLYISTSLVESYSMAIIEALVLNTPLLVLKNDACEGIIKEKFMIAETPDELYSKIKSVLKNRNNYKKLQRMSNFVNENINNLEKLYQLLEN